jgi:murein DD-endopeptidase MepM/ murein hydrolase activator NlpD
MITKTTNANIEYMFDETADIFRVGKKLPYQITLNIGKQAPKDKNIKATFYLPPDFVNSVPKGHGFELFALIYQSGGMEEVDLFDIIPTQFNSSNNTLTVLLPTRVFSNKRTIDKTFEAIFMVATTPGTNIGTGGRIAAGECLAGQVSCPLGKLSECTQKKTSGFSDRIDPVSGEPAYHWGIDFGVSVGTPVFAASDGKIENIRVQKDINGNVTGYGTYMIVRHDNGSATLYAHLSDTKIAKGQSIKAGQEIAKSGNSGKSTGPHLHFEYVPNGEIILSKQRIDPEGCISTGNADGSVTIRDNGTLADDAFSIFLNDVLLGSTQIGGANSIAISNLRPGKQVLKITCTVAPDNVGTYEIILSNGIIFESAGTRVSGTLARGASLSWNISVPKSGRIISTPTLSQPNTYIEK